MKVFPVMPWICYMAGYVFITSGIAKMIFGDFRESFGNLGFPYPHSILFIIAITEIICGTLIVSRLYLRRAAVPLIFIMLAAIFFTKIPILTTYQGFLKFAFEARLDIVMLVLLILIWQHAPRKSNVDK